VTNAYRAQTPLRVGDRDLTLQIDYDAVGAFMTLLDGKDWTAGISRAFEEWDMRTVSRIIHIAAKRHHPDLTAKEIFEASPPFQVAFKAIEAAMFCFLWGHPKALENLDLDEPKEQEGEASEADPLPNGRARWREQGNSLLKWVSAQSSGK